MNQNLKKGKKFTSERQPSIKAKVEGKRKNYLLKQIAGQLLEGESKAAIESLADYLGISIERVDIETAMHLKQIEKAIIEGDTRAYNAVMNRINGKPVQGIDLTSKGKTIRYNNFWDESDPLLD